MEIKVTLNPNPSAKPTDESKLGFGRVFTDHMFVMDWDKQNGWHDARIVPFGNLSIHPASTVLHYGSEIFEGLKAYRNAEGGVQMFRPMENIRRMNRSAARMGCPSCPKRIPCRLSMSLSSWSPSGSPMAKAPACISAPS